MGQENQGSGDGNDPSRGRAMGGFDSLRGLLSEAPLVLFTLDRDGVFTSAEGGAIGVVGVDVGAAVGRSAFELFEGHPAIPGHLRRAVRGEVFETLSEVNDRVFQTRYSPLVGPDGDLVGTVGVALEVSARESAVRALRASEERYRTFTEHAHDAIVEIDRDTRILFASPRLSEITGYPSNLIEGKRGFDFIHPDDRASVEELGGRAFDALTAVELIFRYRHGDGAWHWMELGGRPYRTSSEQLRAVLVMRDVTERIRLEHERLGQMELESRVGQLSRQLLMLEHDDLEDGLQKGLRAAAAMGGADRCYVVSTLAGSGEEPVRLEWTDVSIEPRSPIPVKDAASRHRWTAKQLAAGKVIRTPVVAELPDEARTAREELQAQGIQSCLLIPVRSGGALSGVLGFHCMQQEKQWSDHEVYVLRLVAELLIGALRRRGAEAAFRTSEERFRALAENADDAICEIGADGSIEYANPSYQSLLGYSLEELRAMEPFELIRSDDQQRMEGMHRYSASESRSSGTALYRARHRDGHELWLEASGGGFQDASGDHRMVAVIRDVTERQNNQRKLERQLELEKEISYLSRRFLALASHEVGQAIRDAVEAVGGLADADGCWLLQLSPDARTVASVYAWASDDVATLEGLRGEEPPSFPWARRALQNAEALHIWRVADLPDEAREEREALSRRGVQSFLGIPLVVEHGLIGFLGFETSHREHRWDDETIRRLRLVGEIFVSALRRRRAEEALADSQAQLVQAQKMEAVGTLAGGIAHDFNNQLAVILGNARHVLRRAVEPDMKASLVDLERAAEHCAQLTRALLAFARQTPAKPRSIDSGQALMDVRELLAPLIPRSIDFAVEAEDGVQWISADPTQLQQVLVNLAVNARDALPDGGHIEIRAANRRVGLGEALPLGLPAPGDYVEFSVCDDGVGMEPATRARIFDPFFTTKAPGKGTGLGLATAYGIVRDAGGAIAVESTPGAGATFRVFFPSASSDDDEEESSELVEASAGTETVLLIEDEAPVRRLVERMLVDRGYQVLVATDGVDGLRLSQEHTGRIDIAVTDVVMPNLSGVELAERLLAGRPELQILFISGYPDSDVRPSGARLLRKPFTEPELLNAVRELLDPH